MSDFTIPNDVDLGDFSQAFASGYGLGFGDTYGAAYLQALRDYQPLRISK